ncbi:peptidase inhibitor family I36 protein [Phytohabitans kaempferiae]|uniref:Peptidase inhibitor family I36 protein n=1 Tax=Phytohabitans kaempferiae TaxID=1620943 RepID=A0ABV6M2A0_9ACTN
MLRFAFARARLVVALLAAATTTVAITATAAPARAADVKDRVDAYLAAHPGGVRIGGADIAYGGGRFIVTVTRTDLAAAAAPDCPANWFCFYDGTNYTYPRGKLSDCGAQDLGAWGWRNRTASVHYRMSTGSVTFINETGSTDTPLFTASTGRRTIPDVAPYRDMADYVYRTC